MKQTLSALIICIFSVPSFSAQKKNHWYKVESPKQNPKDTKKNDQLYLKDSLEKSKPQKVFLPFTQWNLKPKLTFGAGFHGDKSFFSQGSFNRFYISGGLRFRVRPTNRLALQFQLMQNDSFFSSIAYEITKKRSRCHGGFLWHWVCHCSIFSRKRLASLWTFPQW